MENRLADIQAQLELESLHQREDVAQIARDGGPDMQERLHDVERRYRIRYNEITRPLIDHDA